MGRKVTVTIVVSRTILQAHSQASGSTTSL